MPERQPVTIVEGGNVGGRTASVAVRRRDGIAAGAVRRRRPRAGSRPGFRTGFRTFVVPAWSPDVRTVRAALVLLLVGVVALAGENNAGGRGANPVPGAGAAGADAIDPAPALARGAPAAAAAELTEQGAGAARISPPSETEARGSQSSSANPGGAELLPTSRILTYYGHPHDQNMGILGEHPKEDLLALLRAEAANYEAIDPSRPVLPAFELISTVAQRDPGVDGTYILDTDLETLTEYVDFAAANDVLVLLDLQIGRGTVADEIAKVRPLLEQPHVHLALDPEFAVADGETPGLYIGELSAEEITYAQETLAELAAEQGLPPKLLIVHQFVEDMIVGKNELAPVPGVQLVIDADGYGAPSHKTEVYDILVRNEPVEFAGVKLFYRQDEPLMTPAEILALDPSPDIIIYQ